MPVAAPAPSAASTAAPPEVDAAMPGPSVLGDLREHTTPNLAPMKSKNDTAIYLDLQHATRIAQLTLCSGPARIASR